MKALIYAAAMMLVASTVQAQSFFSGNCPVAKDLDHGVIITDPARIGELYQRYRKLDGPLVGKSYINGVFKDRMAVTYAGLFTYKYWRDGEVIQYEEPLTDTDELLNFEPGTEHLFESVRYNPANPSRKVRISVKYFFEGADDIALENCTYSSIRVRRKGLLTRANGETVTYDDSYIFIPELLLKISSRYGNVSEVRNRGVWDDEKWPFSQNALDILSD